MIISAIGVISSTPALAGEAAKVATPVADLRVQPKDNAKTIIRLGRGREVAILEKSPDGEWARVSGKLDRFQDQIPFEGWIDVAELNGGDGNSKPKAHAKAKESDSDKSGDEMGTWADDSAKKDEKKSDDLPFGEDKATGAKPSEKPADEKPAEDKPAEEKPADNDGW